MNRATLTGSTFLLGLSALSPSQAHHSVTAHFDMSRTIEIQGTVVDFKLRSPHASLIVDGRSYVDGVLQDEEIQRWEIESSAAPGLRAMGIESTTFQPGDPVTVVAAPNRQDDFRFVNSSTFIDGQGRQYSRAGTAPYQPASPDQVNEIEGIERLAGRWRSPGAFARTESSPLPLNETGLRAWQEYSPRQSPANTCEPMNIPDIFNAPYLLDVEITDNELIIFNQPWDVERRIPLDGESVQAEPSGLFGTVSARIEGDVIIIESRDYPPSRWGLGSATQYLGSGADVPSSPDKQVTERIRLSEDAQTIHYDYTLVDPVYLSGPFSSSLEFSRLSAETPMYPYDCEEESAAMFSRTPEDSQLQVGD